MSLERIRAKYPQYSDLTDAELSARLQEKYYPEFAALPMAEKSAVGLRYFDDKLADEEFRALPAEEQSRIKQNFLSENRLVPAHGQARIDANGNALNWLKDFVDRYSEIREDRKLHPEKKFIQSRGFVPKDIFFNWVVDVVDAYVDTRDRHKR